MATACWWVVPPPWLCYPSSFRFRALEHTRDRQGSWPESPLVVRLSWKNFETDVAERRFGIAPRVDLQAYDSIAGNRGVSLRVIDGLVTIDPKLKMWTFRLDEILIPIILSKNSGHGILVCGGEHDAPTRLVVETSPITFPDISLKSFDLLTSWHALTSKLDT